MRTLKLLPLLILLLSCTHAAKAQTDSSKYYKKVLSDIYREAYKSVRDSLKKDPDYNDAVKNLTRFVNHSNIYSSFTIYGTVSDATYDKLNKDIALHGYPAMKGPLGGVGFGISHEYYSRWVLEFYFTTLGFTNKVKKDDSTLKANFSNLMQVNFGYDFIKSNKINIYPYAGLAVRISELDYTAPVQTNDNYTSILDIVRMDGSAYATKWSLAYQAGVNFDFVIHESASGGGTMLFFRAGTDGAFSNSSFKIHGLKYDPQIKQGAWQATFGFKFFGRN